MRKYLIKTLVTLAEAGVLWLVLAGCQMQKPDKPDTGRWLAGDFHNHTFLTDGSHTPAEVLDHGFWFGLDWITNSEHGGSFARNPDGHPWPVGTVRAGDPPAGTMWRWQSLWRYSFPIVAKTRLARPDKLIAQGYEWNVPAHDHASVAILGPAEEGGLAIARHEYLFDENDAGIAANSQLFVGLKNTENSHDKAVAGVKWLAENYPESSYFLINHPSRKLKYPIAAIRDFNNAAPGVAFGFEGIPGHQKAAGRGGYNGGPFQDSSGQDVTFRARTFGGADFMLAKVGGPWDALLGEGRRFFAFVNSDFHSTTNDFWPGEYAKIYTFTWDKDHDGNYHFDELLTGLRSGNSFIVHGDLIDGLQFTARCLPQAVTDRDAPVEREPERVEMGGVLDAGADCDAQLTIRFRSPAKNNNGEAVGVDHIDLIAGEVRGKAARYLEDGRTPNPDYGKDSNETTRVVTTFTAKDWQDKREGGGEDGWRTINHHLGRPTHDMYFRLRGTNLGRGVANETDPQGNPLSDDLLAPNTAAKAYADLWFYSNPVFVRVRN
ncbi:MAG: hypothetical protein HY885_13215 [Deltaproteobacteria bacterium]|nr:hypothetical protein [Deltaproteobacteria bacterium]